MKSLIKKSLVFVIISLLLFSCSGSANQQKNHTYSIVNISNEIDTGQVLALIYYYDDSGDVYYKVLPNNHSITKDTEYYLGYPVNWTKIENPKQTP